MSKADSSVQHLRAWRDDLVMIEAKMGRSLFMRLPVEWIKDPHWFCQNGHVSGRYLKAERADLCLECHQPVVLGPRLREEDFKALLPVVLQYPLPRLV